MKCLCAIHVDRNQQTFLKQMTSFVVQYDVIYHSLPIISQYLMMWGGGGEGWQPWPCDLQMTAYKKGLLMHDVVQLTCLAVNDILLMQKWNHAFFLLGIAHAWKWQIALLPKEILIKKQTQWLHMSCRSVSCRSIIFVPPTETSGYFSITKFNNK